MSDSMADLKQQLLCRGKIVLPTAFHNSDHYLKAGSRGIYLVLMQ
jgi:hypothetical protein